MSEGKIEAANRTLKTLGELKHTTFVILVMVVLFICFGIKDWYVMKETNERHRADLHAIRDQHFATQQKMVEVEDERNKLLTDLIAELRRQ